VTLAIKQQVLIQFIGLVLVGKTGGAYYSNFIGHDELGESATAVAKGTLISLVRVLVMCCNKCYGSNFFGQAVLVMGSKC
jgi:hypothetical protein